MFRIMHSKKAQSFIEYTVIVMVIATALIAMRQYIQRSANARLKQIQLELDESRR